MRQPFGQQGGNNFRQELSGLSKTKAHSRCLPSPPERALAILTRLGFLMPKEFVREFRVMARSKLLKLVSEDKKLIDARNLNFVFLERIGAAFRKKVTLDSFLTETQRQGWTYA